MTRRNLKRGGMAEVTDRFFAEQADEHVVAVLNEELRSRRSGSRYFTLNVFNVLLVFDKSVVTRPSWD